MSKTAPHKGKKKIRESPKWSSKKKDVSRSNQPSSTAQSQKTKQRIKQKVSRSNKPSGTAQSNTNEICTLSTLLQYDHTTFPSQSVRVSHNGSI